MNTSNVKTAWAITVLLLCWQPAMSQDNIGIRSKATDGAAISISYQLQGEWEVSGLQFDVNYDPKTHTPLLDQCLAGLPESHKGAFATCKALPEKSMVRVVVMDLGRNRILPSDSILGTIAFGRAGKSALKAGSRPTVSNVVLGGTDGKASNAPVDQAFDTIVGR